MEPDHQPLWHLAIVASSSVMLKESTENTLYNMAQVAKIIQLVGSFSPSLGQIINLDDENCRIYLL